MQQRKERIAASIRGELSRIIQSQMHDPRLGFVTVTGVDVSRDLRHARVFVSVLGTEERQEQTLAALAGARGYLRTEVSHALSLRRVPDLDFRLDRSGEQGDRIDRLLREATPAVEDSAADEPGDGSGDEPRDELSDEPEDAGRE